MSSSITIIYGCLAKTLDISPVMCLTSSVIGMIEPIFAGIIAWWLLNEAFTPIQLIGCAVVLVGIYLADKARSVVSKS